MSTSECNSFKPNNLTNSTKSTAPLATVQLLFGKFIYIAFILRIYLKSLFFGTHPVKNIKENYLSQHIIGERNLYLISVFFMSIKKCESA